MLVATLGVWFTSSWSYHVNSSDKVTDDSHTRKRETFPWTLLLEYLTAVAVVSEKILALLLRNRSDTIV